MRVALSGREICEGNRTLQRCVCGARDDRTNTHAPSEMCAESADFTSQCGVEAAIQRCIVYAARTDARNQGAMRFGDSLAGIGQGTRSTPLGLARLATRNGGFLRKLATAVP